MKVQALREKNPVEREKFLIESRKGLRKLRFEIAGQQTKSHRAYRHLRKDIARMLTLMREIE